MTYLDGIKFMALPNLLWPFDVNNITQWRDTFPPLIPDYYIQLDPVMVKQNRDAAQRKALLDNPEMMARRKAQFALARQMKKPAP